MTGNELRAIRQQLGLRQDELAATWGVTRVTIYAWENRGDELVPQPKIMRILCDSLLIDSTSKRVIQSKAEQIMREANQIRIDYLANDKWNDEQAREKYRVLMLIAQDLEDMAKKQG